MGQGAGEGGAGAGRCPPACGLATKASDECITHTSTHTHSSGPTRDLSPGNQSAIKVIRGLVGDAWGKRVC